MKDYDVFLYELYGKYLLKILNFVSNNDKNYKIFNFVCKIKTGE